MADRSLQGAVDSALDMLPQAGSTVEFDEFKASLYSANPDTGKDAFSHIIKNNLVHRELVRGSDGKLKVMLSRIS